MSDEKIPTEVKEGIRSSMTRRDFLKMSGTGLAGAALLGVAGCSTGGDQQQGGKSARTLNTYTSQDIASIEPTLSGDIYGLALLGNVMEGLYALDVNEKPVPGQAKSMSISSDKTTYTFNLRDGIKWSNGDPVTSRDFKYSWLRGINPELAAPIYYGLRYIKGAEAYNSGEGSKEDVAIETPDDKTLTVELASPIPFFLNLVAQLPIYFPQQQSFVEKMGEKYGTSASTLLCNGPFKLTEYEPSQGALMEKNQDYWDKGNVQAEKVDQKVIQEHNTALNLYESGQLDQVGLLAEDMKRYGNSPELSTITKFHPVYSSFYLEDEAMANNNIRRALAIGFDRETLADQILNNGSVPAYGIVPEGVKGPGNKTFREAQGPVMESDPGKAKQLWGKGVEELGRTPKLELLAASDTTGKKVATYMQGEYKKNLGADISLNLKPFSTMFSMSQEGNFQFNSALGYVMDVDDPINILQVWTTGNGFNYSKYSSKEYDQLIESASQETDPDKRMQTLLEAERVLLEDTPSAPQYHSGSALLTKPYVKKWPKYQTWSTAYKHWRLQTQ